jgi:hypothetical protein
MEIALCHQASSGCTAVPGWGNLWSHNHSEKFQKKEELAASFFFFRGDPSRNNGDYFFPTLVSQLFDTLEGIGPFVEDRLCTRALFTKKYQVQIQELLIKPLPQNYQTKELLAASFFFSRGDPSRNKGYHLIPTLISQLVRTFKGILHFIDTTIRENPALFTKTYEIQLQELLIEPLLALKSKSPRDLVIHPRLIVIDGLDECQNPDAQCELLRAIAQAIRQVPYPIRFLVTSRPEAHLTHIFNHDRDLKAITIHRYNLNSWAPT